MSETYGEECTGGVSAARIKALEAKIDAFNKPCPKPKEAESKTKVVPQTPKAAKPAAPAKPAKPAPAPKPVKPDNSKA